MHSRGISARSRLNQLVKITTTVILTACILTSCADPGVAKAGDSSKAQASPSRSTSTGIPRSVPTKLPPPAPGSLAATARTSTGLVVKLHENAMMLVGGNGLPAGTRPALAADLQRQFQKLSRSPDLTNTLGTQLATQLNRYADLAGSLSATHQPNVSTISSTLAALDVQWRTTVARIGADSGRDLLSSLPPLLMPSTATAVPAPR